MKATLISLAICGVFCTTAHAAQKCVKLDSSVTCSNGTGAVGGINWSTTCSNGVVIRGIGVCSADNDTSFGETRDTLTMSERGQNYYCWCKVLSPAVSKYWIRGENGIDGDGCAYKCAYACADAIDYPTFQTNMLKGFE